MEGLSINTIPAKLLARILLQLHILPKNVDLLPILQSALQQYGCSNDLDAFLDHCQMLVPELEANRRWPWESYVIKSDEDWDLANYKKANQLIGIRFLMTSDTARKGIDATRLSRVSMNDEKSPYVYRGQTYAMEELISDTLQYFQQKCTLNDNEGDGHGATKDEIESSGLLTVLQRKLDQCLRDKRAFQERSDKLDSADYHLTGVLLVKYSNLNFNKSTVDTWCLYLRDYRGNNADGSVWRVILENQEEINVSTKQALADIRGEVFDRCHPSPFSWDYRPAYVFYGNISTLEQFITTTTNTAVDNVAAASSTVQPQSPAEQNHPAGSNITLADYIFDDEEYDPSRFADDYAYSATEAIPDEDDTPCYHCRSSADEKGNDMFICDGCNQGFHQLCEVPPIRDHEKELDPWFCRACSKTIGSATAEPVGQTPLNLTSYHTTLPPLPSIAEQEAIIPKTAAISESAASLHTMSASTAATSYNTTQHAIAHIQDDRELLNVAELATLNGADVIDHDDTALSKRKREDEDVAQNRSDSRHRRGAQMARRSHPFRRTLDHF